MMAKLPLEKMRELDNRFDEIEARMAQGPDAETYVKLASEIVRNLSRSWRPSATMARRIAKSKT